MELFNDDMHFKGNPEELSSFLKENSAVVDAIVKSSNSTTVSGRGVIIYGIVVFISLIACYFLNTYFPNLIVIWFLIEFALLCVLVVFIYNYYKKGWFQTLVAVVFGIIAMSVSLNFLTPEEASKDLKGKMDKAIDKEIDKETKQGNSIDSLNLNTE